MKSRALSCCIAITLLATLVVPAQMSAQQHHHYQVIDLRTFGGANSYVGTSPVLQILNNQSVVAGVADRHSLAQLHQSVFRDQCF